MAKNCAGPVFAEVYSGYTKMEVKKTKNSSFPTLEDTWIGQFQPATTGRTLQ